MALPDTPCAEAAPPAVAAANRLPRRRLVINADDFGRSADINAAVLQAHTDGVLTAASLMVGEESFDEAVEIARKYPSLGVGLHLTLLCGRSVLPPQQIPGLVNSNRCFTNCPVTAGMRYFFLPGLRRQIEAELEAQFEKFFATGLPLDHVNGHLHFHLHPTVLRIITANARRWNLRHVRLTHDPFWMNARLAAGRWTYRASHAFVFRALSGRARKCFRSLRLRHTDRVFGLLQDSRMDEDYVSRLLAELPEGDSELYSHPSPTRFKHELDALLSPRVKAIIEQRGIELVRYQDLS
jgi:chitin disaccharide deacetylase